MLKKMVLFCLLFIAGCSWFGDKRVVIPEQSELVNSKQRWMILAPYIKSRFKTDITVEEIAAELAYQEYLLFSQPQHRVSKN